MDTNDITQTEMAKTVGIERGQLNKLLNMKRPLSAYYLNFFITRGIIRVSDIYDGKPENEKEHRFWKAAERAQRWAMLERIVRIEEKGIDLDRVLDGLDPEWRKT